MKILCVGDQHGNGSSFDFVCSVAREKGIEQILQHGDWGHWTHTDWGKRFIEYANRSLMHNEVKCWFVDGNHESFSELYKLPLDPDTGRRPITENIDHLPRGYRWEWDGVKFLAMGGAHSIDRDPQPAYGWKGRTEGWDWWPEELITDEQIELGIAGGPVDVLASHDAPISVKVPGLHSERKEHLYPETTENRIKLERLVKAVRPKLIVHGHMHVRYSGEMTFPIQKEFGGPMTWHWVRVEGLDRDGQFPGCMWVLDTEKFKSDG